MWHDNEGESVSSAFAVDAHDVLVQRVVSSAQSADLADTESGREQKVQERKITQSEKGPGEQDVARR